MEKLSTGVYLHSKSGGTVFVYGTGKNSNGEQCVFYIGMQTGELISRPIDDFLGFTTKDGKQVPRFKLVEEKNADVIKLLGLNLTPKTDNA